MVNMTSYQAFDKCWNEGKRIVELEDIISTDSYNSYRYALYIIKGPWEPGEKSILKTCLWSFNYACYVIKGPFEKSHSFIFNSKFRDNYIDFLKSINYDLNKISEWLI